MLKRSGCGCVVTACGKGVKEKENAAEDKRMSVGESLLTPTRIYVKACLALVKAGLAKGMAHITGGGLIDNLPRVLPDGTSASIEVDRWQRPPLFEWLIAEAGLELAEALRIFNCGIGMVVVAEAGDADAVQAAIAEPTWIIGVVVADPGPARVTLA